MAQDMSEGVKIAVILVVIGFVLSVGMVITKVGQSFTRSYMTTVGDTASLASTSEIEAIATYDDDIPAATVYVVLAKDPGLIEEINGTAYGVTVDSIDDLSKLFKKQIHVTVMKHLDRYKITISP